MSLRYSVEDALKRGWIRERPQLPALLLAAQRPERPAPKRDSGSPAHDQLHAALLARYGDRVHREYAGAVPGRRFRLDLAVPDCRCAIEVDGWQHHGMTLRGFKRDRLRQNLLCIHGWRVLRYFPGQIYQDLDAVMAEIEVALGGAAVPSSEPRRLKA